MGLAKPHKNIANRSYIVHNNQNGKIVVDFLCNMRCIPYRKQEISFLKKFRAKPNIYYKEEIT